MRRLTPDPTGYPKPVAIVVQYTTSVTAAQYDEVISRIRFHDEPPEGPVVHTAAATADSRMGSYECTTVTLGTVTP